MESFTASIIVVIIAIIFWRFVLGMPLMVAYRCPKCRKLLVKSFTYRVERCPSCNFKIDWNQLIKKKVK